MKEYQINYPIEVVRISRLPDLYAVGGDLSVDSLLHAYKNGYFPCFSHWPPMWWKPLERGVLFPDKFHVSKSLQRTIHSGKYQLKINTSFKKVMQHCARTNKKNEYEIWITPEMIEAYCQLFDEGYAHSFETWKENQLVGGLYGIALGKLFVGESMFSLQTDASKFALFHLCRILLENNFLIIDCQWITSHLQSLGAEVISRRHYRYWLTKALKTKDLKTNFYSVD